MIIKITAEDIAKYEDPIKEVVRRDYGLDVIVDSRFFMVKGGFPFRLPLSAEVFQKNLATGGVVQPLEFEIAG
jgi:hypothetical protein